MASELDGCLISCSIRKNPAPADWYPRLTRASGDAMAFGVLGGLGRFFGVDPTWLRIAYAVGTFFTGILPGVITYGILALIVPSDAPAKSQLPE